jgi:hypothetical protein
METTFASTKSGHHFILMLQHITSTICSVSCDGVCFLYLRDRVSLRIHLTAPSV